MRPDYAGLLSALRPEASLVLGALAVLSLDLTFFRARSLVERQRLALFVGALAVASAGADAWLGARGPAFGGVLILDPLAVAARVGVLALTLLTLGVAWGSAPSRQPAEYVAVILFAATGLVLMAAAQQLLIVFLALELASLSLYVIAGFDRSRPESAEAALKYFLFGGMAAAFLLFGFSLIYGVTGSIELPRIAAQLAVQGASPLLLVALVMVLVAFGFKVAAAPFHLWAPDVYQGAPAPSAALIASASKLAGFTLFTRLLWPGFGAAAGNPAAHAGGSGWLPTVALLAGASLVLGNLAALAQASLRRLLAYSAIGHAGAMLLGVMAAGRSGPAPLFYYASTYGLATVGAFGVISAAERGGRCELITDLAGLHRRSPLLAACLTVFILSLAGIPPLAGFFGKFFVFAAALGLGGLAGGLALLAIALSAVAL
ncbi:MAG TPA: NADH-quinone oxidoreductase subunit N, partial [Opitutaceae bacterium]|nr:NADH-quinone oxidoreductase subunit N [Opitutaceae bacterium]